MARPPRVDVLIDPAEDGGAGAGRGRSGGGGAYYNNRSAPTALDTNILIVTSSLFAVLILALCMHFAIRWALSHFCHLRPHPADSAPPVSPPSAGLHKLHVDSLPTQLYCQNAEVSLILDATSSSSSQCPICLSDFADGERIRVLPGCHHGFHMVCIDRWLAEHTSCPTCRGDLMDALPKEVRLHILITPTAS